MSDVSDEVVEVHRVKVDDGENTSSDQSSTEDVESSTSEVDNTNDKNEIFGSSICQGNLRPARTVGLNACESTDDTSEKDQDSYFRTSCIAVPGDILSLFTPVEFDKDSTAGSVNILGHQHHPEPVSLKHFDGLEELFLQQNCVLLSEHQVGEPMDILNLVHIGNTFTNASMNPILHCGVQGRKCIERLFSIFYTQDPTQILKSVLIEHIFGAFHNITVNQDLYTKSIKCSICNKCIPPSYDSDDGNSDIGDSESEDLACYSCRQTFCKNIFCKSCVNDKKYKNNSEICQDCHTNRKEFIERRYMKYHFRCEVKKMIIHSPDAVSMKYHCIHQAIVYGLNSLEGCKIIPLSPSIEANSWFRLMYLLHQMKVFLLHLDGTVSHSVSCIIENGCLAYTSENHPWLTYSPDKKANTNQPVYNLQIFQCATKTALTSCIRKLQEASSVIQCTENLYVFVS